MQTDGLYRVLRALASLGIFAESSPRTFALTPAAELLRKGPGSLGDGIEFITDPLHFQTYAETLHSVQTGQPAAEKVVGMPVFENLARRRVVDQLQQRDDRLQRQRHAGRAQGV